MANLLLSGYLASATAVVWTSGQALASLTNNEFTDLADEIDNSTDKYPYVDLYLVLASAAFTGATSAIQIYLVPCIDGTNYPTWTGNGTSDEQENVPYFVVSLPTTGTTAAQAVAALRVPLPNGKYKWAARNVSGVTLAASGNTLYWRPHTVAA